MQLDDLMAAVLVAGGYAHEAGAPFAPPDADVDVAWRGLANTNPIVLPPEEPILRTASAAEYDSKVMTPKGKKHKKEDE